MDFYEISMQGLYKLFTDCGKPAYADILAGCISEWRSKKSFVTLTREYSPGGRMAAFSFREEDFASEEERFWTTQLLGGLTAMALKLAEFRQQKQPVDIGFIRKYFGYPSDFISASACERCGFRQISMEDIDRYIARPVIAARIVSGLERGSLDECVEVIRTVSAPEIAKERELARVRANNTNVAVSSSRSDMPLCILCGSRSIKKIQMLRNLRENNFVQLNG